MRYVYYPGHAFLDDSTICGNLMILRQVTVSSILKEESNGDWETQCTLLLWLSILVLIPFDMASVDTALTDSGPSCGNSSDAVPPLVERMIRMCKEYLANPGPVREMAGVLLARLLSRPDMRAALNRWVPKHGTLRTNGMIDEFLVDIMGDWNAVNSL